MRASSAKAEKKKKTLLWLLVLCYAHKGRYLQSNDGDGKASLVETARSLQGRKINAARGVLDRPLLTGIRFSTTQRGVDIAAARSDSVAGGICEIDKASQEAQV